MKVEKNSMFWEIFVDFACVEWVFGSLFFRAWRPGLGLLLGGLLQNCEEGLGSMSEIFEFWTWFWCWDFFFFTLILNLNQFWKTFFLGFNPPRARVWWCAGTLSSADTETRHFFALKAHVQVDWSQSPRYWHDRYLFLHYFREVLIVKVTDFVAKSCSHSRTPLNPYSNINFVVTFCFPFANFQQNTSKGFLW